MILLNLSMVLIWGNLGTPISCTVTVVEYAISECTLIEHNDFNCKKIQIQYFTIMAQKYFLDYFSNLALGVCLQISCCGWKLFNTHNSLSVQTSKSLLANCDFLAQHQQQSCFDCWIATFHNEMDNFFFKSQFYLRLRCANKMPVSLTFFFHLTGPK